MQTETPYWLKEAYAQAITLTDVGLIRRNMELGGMLKVMLPLIADPGGTFIDYGGGYGILVRMMRDAGFDFRWYDASTENLFAKNFEADRSATYALLSAFEVFEHLENPRQGLHDMLELSDQVLFSTALLPEPCPLPEQWWYYGLDHGQHVSLYSLASLEVLAAAAGAYLHTNGINIHLIARRRVSDRLFRIATRKTAAVLLAPLFKRKSLLQDDFAASIRQLCKEPPKP